MTDQIPLNYVVAKAQVAQYIEGGSASLRTGLNTLLKTVAISTPNTYPVTFAASKD